MGLVWANLNGYIDLPEAVTKFIPPQYLPAADIAEAEAPAAEGEAPAAEEAAAPETYEEEMATYEGESASVPETYEEEYMEEGAPEAYRAW